LSQAVRQYTGAKNRGGVASMRHGQPHDACMVRYVDLIPKTEFGR
jgi:hypothetical protein